MSIQEWHWIEYVETGYVNVKILKEIDSKKLSKISKKCLLLVDGEGVKRTVSKIFQTVN